MFADGAHRAHCIDSLVAGGHDRAAADALDARFYDESTGIRVLYDEAVIRALYARTCAPPPTRAAAPRYVPPTIDVRSNREFLMRCRACGSTDINVQQRQTRSADESMTVFCTCCDCGKRFRV